MTDSTSVRKFSETCCRDHFKAKFSKSRNGKHSGAKFSKIMQWRSFQSKVFVEIVMKIISVRSFRRKLLRIKYEVFYLLVPWKLYIEEIYYRNVISQTSKISKKSYQANSSKELTNAIIKQQQWLITLYQVIENQKIFYEEDERSSW